MLTTVPVGYTDEEYVNSTWIRKLKIAQVALLIHPSSFPSPVTSMSMVNNPMAQNNTAIAANLKLSDLSKSKFKQAKALEGEINASNAEAIGAIFAKDMGKRKMEEARELEKQQNEAMGGAVGQMFAGSLADSMIEKAHEAKAEEDKAQQENVAMMFAKGSVKKQFRYALETKNMKLAEECAATMLKNAWKGKKARERTKRLRIEKQRLLEEGMARKLQSRYRTRLARKKVERLKAEKLRLREEVAAIIVQSNWRIKKARERVVRLKAEKQRLMEEGAALRVQSRWRIRQAKQKVSGLKKAKAAHEKKLENARLKILLFLLMWRAKLSMRKKRQQMKQMVNITIHNARDINVGDAATSSSDPYVIVHVESSVRSMSTATASGTAIAAKGGTRSRSKTTNKDGTLMPVWNEKVLAINVTFYDKIVLTLMDKDNFHADKFLGQVVIDISKEKNIYLNKPIKKTDHPIGAFREALHDVDGKSTPWPKQEIPGKGFLTFSMELVKPMRNRCGWMLKQAAQKLGFLLGGGATFKPRFVVIWDGILTYHDNELTLDVPRDRIVCSEIRKLTYLPDSKHGNKMTLTVKTDKQEWIMQFLEHEIDKDISDWIGCFQANCPHISLNDDRSNSASRSYSTARTESTSNPAFGMFGSGKFK
jgi:hypothetical protein